MLPLLKYCGNHSLEDLEVSLQSKANYIGVVFAESKRKVTACDINEWLSKVSWNPNKKLVGLFVNEEIDEIKNILEIVPLDIVQCHGNESVEYVKELSEQIELPIWKVIHHLEGAWDQMEAYAPYVEGFVVDSKVSGAWGGTGVTFDWSHIPNYLKEAKRLNKKVFIAGGINPENVNELLKYNPVGIDVSSGIEQSGEKSLERIEQLEERIEKNDSNA